MTAADEPVLIAYDGSDTARRAVREAAKLFGSRQVLVVTVWEPGLAYETTENFFPHLRSEIALLPPDVSWKTLFSGSRE